MQSSQYSKEISLWDDKIGKVEYVQHMGDDVTIVNAARVSFGKHKPTLAVRTFFFLLRKHVIF